MLPALRRAGLSERCILFMLALCVGLQGLAVAAQRAGGPAHVHRGAGGVVDQTAGAYAAIPEAAGHDGGNARHLPPHTQGAEGGAFAGHDHDHNHDHDHHDHAVPAHHAHAAGDVGVVYLGDDDRASLTGHLPSLARGANDLDALMALPALAPEPARSARWPRSATATFRSHVGDPAEPPPRG